MTRLSWIGVGFVMLVMSFVLGIPLWGLIGTLIHHTDPWRDGAPAITMLWALLVGIGAMAILGAVGSFLTGKLVGERHDDLC